MKHDSAMEARSSCFGKCLEAFEIARGCGARRFYFKSNDSAIRCLNGKVDLQLLPRPKVKERVFSNPLIAH